MVVGDVTNHAGNEEKVRRKGVHVEIVEIPEGVTFSTKYLYEKPDQHREDAGGLAEVRKAAAGKR
jgi:hypothetical protein